MNDDVWALRTTAYELHGSAQNLEISTLVAD